MSDEFGYGLQLPKERASNFNALSFVVQQLLGRASVATLVKVLSCTNSGGLTAVGYVDVLPLVNQIDGLGYAVPHGRIYKLPYFRLQGGKNAVIMDPEANDIGVAVFADRDISTVKNTKAQANPGSRRRFDMSDGLYLGGFLNGTPNQYVEFITGTGIKITDSNGNVVNMNSNGVDITAARLTCTGAIIGGFGGADQVGLQTHIHDQGTDSGGDSEVPTTAPVAGT